MGAEERNALLSSNSTAEESSAGNLCKWGDFFLTLSFPSAAECDPSDFNVFIYLTNAEQRLTNF